MMVKDVFSGLDHLDWGLSNDPRENRAADDFGRHAAWTSCREDLRDDTPPNKIEVVREYGEALRGITVCKCSRKLYRSLLAIESVRLLLISFQGWVQNSCRGLSSPFAKASEMFL